MRREVIFGVGLALLIAAGCVALATGIITANAGGRPSASVQVWFGVAVSYIVGWGFGGLSFGDSP